MERRTFIKNSTILSVGLITTKNLFAKNTGTVYGHNGITYQMNNQWGALNPEKTPVNDCHEMIQDNKGRILLLTNETKNNIIIYNKSGKLMDTWGTVFPWCAWLNSSQYRQRGFSIHHGYEETSGI